MRSPTDIRRFRPWIGILTSLFALAPAACAKDAESSEIPASASASTAVHATPVEAPAPAPAPSLAAEPPAAAKAVAQPTGQDDAVAADGRVVGSDASYTVELDAPGSLAKGGSGVVRVKVTPKKGWKMNKEFPTKLEVAAPDGVKVEKAKQKVKDAERFESDGATFAVKFTADSAGSKAFTAKFKFAVCTDATCDPKKQELAWVVDVK